MKERIDSVAPTLEQRIKRRAHALGFVACGIARVGRLAHEDALRSWLDRGMAGGMAYMHRTRDSRADPRALLPSARSAIVVAASYRAPAEGSGGPRGGPVPTSAPKARPSAATDEPAPAGRVARYARGVDYHRVLKERLGQLASWIRREVEHDLETRIAVDTAPLLERELAMAAGIGFIGKNTLLITPGVGSYTVLGTLLTSLELAADEPGEPRCGSCDLCLRGCPTDAFSSPYVLDARSCISYLTIEHRGPISEQLAEQMGDWVFGCDVCQELCPYNRPIPGRAAPAPDPDLAADGSRSALPLSELLRMRSGSYRRLVRGRALGRVSRPRWIRNAAIAAGNQIIADSPGDGADARRDRDADLDRALIAALDRGDPASDRAVGWAIDRRIAGRDRGAIRRPRADPQRSPSPPRPDVEKVDPLSGDR